MKTKIFILHEIYGVNDFIQSQRELFKNAEIECVFFYEDNRVFSYEEEQQAYVYFKQAVGFEKPLDQLKNCIAQSRKQYDKIFVIGYSVGATMAWQLSECQLNGIICVYGSRIRQYMDVIPKSSTLVILPSKEHSFDVNELKDALDIMANVQTLQFQGLHGFMDSNNPNYHKKSASLANLHIRQFINKR